MDLFKQLKTQKICDHVFFCQTAIIQLKNSKTKKKLKEIKINVEQIKVQ